MGRSRIFVSLARWRLFKLILPSWRGACLSEMSQEKGNAPLHQGLQGVGYIKETLIRRGQNLPPCFPETADLTIGVKLPQKRVPCVPNPLEFLQKKEEEGLIHCPWQGSASRPILFFDFSEATALALSLRC